MNSRSSNKAQKIDSPTKPLKSVKTHKKVSKKPIKKLKLATNEWLKSPIIPLIIGMRLKIAPRTIIKIILMTLY